MLTIGVVDFGPGHFAGGDDGGVLVERFHGDPSCTFAGKRWNGRLSCIGAGG
jgi:hypothetical protein